MGFFKKLKGIGKKEDNSKKDNIKNESNTFESEPKVESTQESEPKPNTKHSRESIREITPR